MQPAAGKKKATPSGNEQKIYGAVIQTNCLIGQPSEIDLIFDGVPVPFEAWADAYNIPRDEFANLTVIHPKTKEEGTKIILVKKGQFIIASIFQWNRQGE